MSRNSVNVGFTDAAKAGLAAIEDFSAIKLKQSDSETLSHVGEVAPPFNDLMLIQIKGNSVKINREKSYFCLIV